MQGQVRRLPRLGRGGVDGEQGEAEAHVGPAQPQELASARPRVHADEDCRHQVITLVERTDAGRLDPHDDAGENGCRVPSGSEKNQWNSQLRASCNELYELEEGGENRQNPVS